MPNVLAPRDLLPEPPKTISALRWLAYSAALQVTIGHYGSHIQRDSDMVCLSSMGCFIAGQFTLPGASLGMFMTETVPVSERRPLPEIDD